ncbi:hypothetical protein AFB00_30665 (plasmid) [Pseudonocardia sp. HH130630-07]|nr:hypothetical protein AFB00_30665 [Pseudonocardia sp. HH130630-07]
MMAANGDELDLSAAEDPVTAAYVAAVAALSAGTATARPGSTDGVLAADPGPVTDGEYVTRLEALHHVAGALIQGLATLRDSDAATRAGAVDQLRDATTRAWETSTMLTMLRRPPAADEHDR